MIDRWMQGNQNLPNCDFEDICQENSLVNPYASQAQKHQHDPEYSQSSYLKIRSLEEAYPLKNYLGSNNSESQPESN